MAWSSNFNLPLGIAFDPNSSLMDGITAKPSDYGVGGSGSSEFLDFAKWMYGPQGQAARRAGLRDTLDFQKEQMGIAGKYKMMFDMPEKIAKAFTVPAAVAATGDIAAANALATGALNTANITARAGENLGGLYASIKPTPVQVGSTNYNLY